MKYYVSVLEAAKRIGIAWRTARARVKKGVIPSVKDPFGKRRIKREDFDKWLTTFDEADSKPKPDEACLYAIQAGKEGPIKIGVSTRLRVNLRLGTLQTGHHEALRLLGVYRGNVKNEQALHRKLKHWRIRGEWFRPSPGVLKALKTLKNL